VQGGNKVNRVTSPLAPTLRRRRRIIVRWPDIPWFLTLQCPPRCNVRTFNFHMQPGRCTARSWICWRVP